MLVDVIDGLQSRLLQQTQERAELIRRDGNDTEEYTLKMRRQIAKFCAFARIVTSFKEISTCRNPAGAVIVPLDYSKILSIGYSGPARGRPNDTCMKGMHGGPKKPWTDCFCPTAIVNALMNAPALRARSAFMICSMAPTEYEAGMILNHGGVGWLFFEQKKTLMKSKESEHIDGTKTLAEYIRLDSLIDTTVERLMEMDTRSRFVYKRD